MRISSRHLAGIGRLLQGTENKNAALRLREMVTVLRRHDIVHGLTPAKLRAILTHLFCPHCALDPPHSFGYASGLPPCSDEKIYANLRVYFISDSYKDSIPVFYVTLTWLPCFVKLS